MKLDRYTVSSYTPGVSLWQQILWYYMGAPMFGSRWVPISGIKCLILRVFGAKLGQGIRIKPGVTIKFPWRLVIGDHVWIGENCWIDNVAVVTIESHVCISQDVYLCTGNHDWTDPTFKLLDQPIYLEEGCWIAARAVVGPGVSVGRGAVLGLGAVAGRSLEPMTIYAGNPAQSVKQRVISL
jgi:putative colanic acid biosynthesis acetyltransferase WcaF